MSKSDLIVCYYLQVLNKFWTGTAIGLWTVLNISNTPVVSVGLASAFAGSDMIGGGVGPSGVPSLRWIRAPGNHVVLGANERTQTGLSGLNVDHAVAFASSASLPP